MWATQRGQRGVEVLTVQRVVDKPMMNSAIDNEELIKMEMSREFAKHIYESGHIQFDVTQDPYNLQTVYRANLSVTEPGIQKVVVDEYVYKVRDLDFTHSQIEEAILAKFPEYFL